MRLTESEFIELVAQAIQALPDDILGLLDNIEIVVSDWPSRDQLGATGGRGRSALLGLYEGVPLTGRTTGYGMVLPDRITVFRGPVLRACRTDAEVRSEVQRTVVHELAHHFGIDDDRLEELDAY